MLCSHTIGMRNIVKIGDLWQSCGRSSLYKQIYIPKEIRFFKHLQEFAINEILFLELDKPVLGQKLRENEKCKSLLSQNLFSHTRSPGAQIRKASTQIR